MPSIVSRVRLWLSRRDGYLLAWVVVIMAFGALALAALMPTVAASLIATRRGVENVFAYYAADAAITAVVRDLIQGKDARAATYSPPVVGLNGYTATVSVAAPATALLPAVYYQYADPGATLALASLAAGGDYVLVVNNVQAGSDILVNWAFTPSARLWRIRIYAGSGLGGARLTNDSGSSGPATSFVPGTRVSGGAYTIQFSNRDSLAITSNAYGASGGATNTWVWVNAYKDYVVTAGADHTSVAVFARQFPGPTNPPTPQSVKLESWRTP